MTSRWRFTFNQLMDSTLAVQNLNHIDRTINMTHKCFACKKTGLSLFSLPVKDTARCNEWLSRLQSIYRVPEHISTVRGYRVCSSHFRDCDQYHDGKRMRLFRNVYPVPPPPEDRIEGLPSNGSSDDVNESSPPKVKRRDVAVQVASALGQGSVYALKLSRQVERLKEKNKSMVNNLKPNWVLKNRYKLASFMSDDAFMLFDCHIRNFGRARQGRRFTPDDRRITSKIQSESPEAYRVLQKIFTLPTQNNLDEWPETEDTNGKKSD